MHFSIDNASERPVYQQIIDQIKRDIALGRLTNGQKLPTVRQLAGELVINPNTIAKAYRQLEQGGIIVTKPGSGAFVAAISSSISGSVRKRIIVGQLQRAVVDAVHMQIDKKTLVNWFEQTTAEFKIE